MDSGWIQVFVLTIAECVAPAGKTVCQESQYELQFLTKGDCDYALQELLDLKSRTDNIIVDKSKSKCVPTARQSDVYPDLESITAANSGQPGWKAPTSGESASGSTPRSHQERLAKLKSCEETNGVAPCAIGEIIIEGAAQEVEVWRRDQ